MDRELQLRLQNYIDAETVDAQLYRALSRIAPDEDARQLLMEFSEDEAGHAAEFRQIYKNLFGRNYSPEVKPPDISMPYRDMLLDRVIDESGDFRKYGQQYIVTLNPVLKNAYYTARTDENVHALRLLYLLSKE